MDALYQIVAETFATLPPAGALSPDADEPSTESVPGEPTAQPDIQVGLARFPGVVADYTVEQMPAAPPADDVSPYEAHPPLALVRLPGYAGGQPAQPPYLFGAPAIQVYRVSDMLAFEPHDNPHTFAGQYEALQTLLAEQDSLAACSGVTLKPGQNMTYPVLPFAPMVNAAQIFCTQPAHVEFDGGRGVRYVTTFSQAIDLLADQSVFYTFQGLTDDGRYYISAVLPVTTGVLPATAGEGFDPQTWTTMVEGWADELAALEGAGFRPSLDALDQVVRSITVR
jgi:hypothetical protein